MASDSNIFFPPFRLDSANAQLWRDQTEINLRPKTFDVLRCLVDNPGKLVTKTMLLDAVWGEVSVSDTMPASCVVELRRALQDDPKTPKYIQTVHRRGYRFIAPVTTKTTFEARPKRADASKINSILVGRDDELARLDRWYSQVSDGRRLVVFVAGEAGIGKSAFVQDFLELVRKDGVARISRGQCVEQYGSGEPYMPVLEALTRLSREDGGRQIVEVLNRFAPTWLAQMPGLLDRDERARLESEIHGVTQQRMLREMMNTLEALTTETPLVLLLEDLHWSDFSTLELISAIARRPEPARLLIIGTYRPVEILATNHPLRTMKHELQLHRHCEELRLRLLTTENVSEYLKKRLPGEGTQGFGTLAPVVHARTDGNPLFMVNVVDYLLGKSGLAISGLASSKLKQGEALVASELETPGSIREMIERNLERLMPDEQAVLEVASVVGPEFSAASVAAALERPQDEIEACCTRLSRREQFVSMQGSVTWPDGTIATGFRFHHALYQEVLYGRLPISHQLRFHHLIALRAETGFGERAEEVAAELAYHYRRANDRDKAIQYLRLAGQRAIMRGAMIEAERHFAGALALLAQLPKTFERDHRELELQVALGSTLVVVKGWAALETGQAYNRARELCDRVSDSPEHFPTLFGIYATYLVRGEVSTARTLAEKLMQRAGNTENSALKLYAHIALGVILYFMGNFPAALQHLEMAGAIYDRERHRVLMLRFGFDAGVWCLCYTAGTLWHLGYADRALKRAEDALALGQSLSHPLNLAQAELWMGMLRQFRQEALPVIEITGTLITRAAEHGITDWLDWAGCLHGWGTAAEGHHDQGISEIRQSRAALEARGAGVWHPYFMFLLSDACLRAGLIEAGLSSLDDAAAAIAKYEEREHEANIYLLKGKLLLGKAEPDSKEADKCFDQAIAIARRQGAKFVELNATVNLAKSNAGRGNREGARAMLTEVYNWFTEGFDTPALLAAKALLDELAAKPGPSGAAGRSREHR